MIRILLVDDDVHAIESIAKTTNWAELGINEAYTAYSLSQAQNVLMETDIDILLSDIEMPKGSGLELVQWASSRQEGMVCLFLTSHANFSYANTALRLGSMDYLLKPAPRNELYRAIAKAVERVHALRKRRSETQEAIYWNESRRQIEERFWLEVVCGILPADREQIRCAAARRHIDLPNERKWPALIELCPIADIAWEPDLLETAITNVLSEMLSFEGTAPVILRLDNDCRLVLSEAEHDETWFLDALRKSVSILSALFDRTVRGCTGKAHFPEGLFGQVSLLLSQKNGLIPGNGEAVFFEQSCHLEKKNSERLIERWMTELTQNQSDVALCGIRAYLTDAPSDRTFCARFFHDFMSGIHSLLEFRGLSPDRLFYTKEDTLLACGALQSPDGLMKWICHVTDWLSSVQSDDSYTNAVELAKVYIEEHLRQNIRRTDIAATVHLSPDHLSHLFKSRTGSSLSDFILERRIAMAKKLLSTTRYPIGKVAAESGYDSIPYFSKQFKRTTGKTPLDYRKSQFG